MTQSLRCANCGAPTTINAPACAFCRAPLVWNATVPLERGVCIRRIDGQRQSPFEGADLRAGPGGTTVDLPAGDSRGMAFPELLRNGCVCVHATTFDTGAYIRAHARVHPVGTATFCYELHVSPSNRTFHILKRVRASAGLTCAASLRLAEFSPAIAPLGHLNQVELRCGDSAIQALVNGQRLLTLEDASFGFGRFGCVVGAQKGKTHPARGRTVVRGVELFHLA